VSLPLTTLLDSLRNETQWCSHFKELPGFKEGLLYTEGENPVIVYKDESGNHCIGYGLDRKHAWRPARIKEYFEFQRMIADETNGNVDDIPAGVLAEILRKSRDWSFDK